VTKSHFVVIWVAAILLIGALVLSIWSARKREQRNWNGGRCRDCQGIWKQFSLDSGGSRGYKCSGCSRHIWISYKVDK
jgi:hypothetical protein